MSSLEIVFWSWLALAARVRVNRFHPYCVSSRIVANRFRAFGAGSIGVQLAKQFGAYVIATCSAASADLVKSLGADEIIDYRTQNFTEVLKNDPVSCRCHGLWNDCEGHMFPSGGCRV